MILKLGVRFDRIEVNYSVQLLPIVLLFKLTFEIFLDLSLLLLIYENIICFHSLQSSKDFVLIANYLLYYCSYLSNVVIPPVDYFHCMWYIPRSTLLSIFRSD